MSKVLLTGGMGFIGSHTAVSLIENGYDVVIVDNLVNSEEDVVHRLEKFKNVTIPFYNGDCRDENLLDKIFNEHDIEIVIHFAGLKAVGESVSLPLEYYENNLNATISLLKSMLKNKVHKLVFSSSATVYDEDNPDERVEGYKLGCTNPYGWTKFMCEQIIRDTCHANSQLNAISLRYFNPVGAHPSGIIGENPKGVPNNLMPYIQQVATGVRDYLRVYGNDYDTVDGTGVRDYIHVCDLADAHVAASKYLQNNKGCLEINIGTGKGASVLEMVEAFEKANKIKIPYKIEARRPGDVAINYANANKAYKLLGWKATRTLEDMCKDAYNWQCNLQKKHN
ncbi:MAG: UDP-glucose 4-epimerase GalE [Bacillota bacterium]|jgi:UDP-glucose 4-epimerase|nr:UDP-glucose 4-epimerase GalE [Bacillota bacterium]NLL26162.1 UDP-glucose 4-epimerase GalE [Erysipelotrichia bacterium]